MKTSIQSHFRLILFVVVAASVSLGLADDFKTIEGKEYKDAIVSRVEPDGIVVKTKSGISKLYFVELPPDVQRRFNYDQQQARAYSAEQAVNYAAAQKQEEEAQHQRDEAAAQTKQVLIEQQPDQGSKEVLQRERPTPRSTPRYTTVLHQLPQTQPPRPTPRQSALPKTPNNPTTPNKPVHHAAAAESHSKSQGKKAHK
jgi:hypothetical protein